MSDVEPTPIVWWFALSSQGWIDQYGLGHPEDVVLPAHDTLKTFDAPQAVSPSTHRWDGSAWVELTPAEQGYVYDPATGLRAAPPEPPAPTLDELRAAKLEAMQTAKAQALDAMTYQGHRVTISPVDIINVQGALGFLQAQGAGATMRWEVETNVFIDVDAAWLGGLLQAGTAYVTAVYARASELQAQIAAAADPAALAAIDVTAGWP